MYTERRRRHFTITTFTSVLYFLLAMLHAGSALPSSYLKFLKNDNRLSSFDSSQPFVPSSGSSSSSVEELSPPLEYIFLQQGRPISLKEFAASLSSQDEEDPSSGDEIKPRLHSSSSSSTSNLIVKRQPQNSGEESTMLRRLARNMPHNGIGEKMYQISNIGDLPMFRFG